MLPVKLYTELPGLCVLCKTLVIMIKTERLGFATLNFKLYHALLNSCRLPVVVVMDLVINSSESKAISVYYFNILDITGLKTSSLDKTYINLQRLTDR